MTEPTITVTSNTFNWVIVTECSGPGLHRWEEIDHYSHPTGHLWCVWHGGGVGYVKGVFTDKP